MRNYFVLQEHSHEHDDDESCDPKPNWEVAPKKPSHPKPWREPTISSFATLHVAILPVVYASDELASDAQSL